MPSTFSSSASVIFTQKLECTPETRQERDVHSLFAQVLAFIKRWNCLFFTVAACLERQLIIFFHTGFSLPLPPSSFSLSLSDRYRHHHWPKSLFSSTLTPVSVQTPRRNTTPPHERHVTAAATILTWAPSLTCANCSNVLSLHVGGWWWSLPTLLPNAKWSRDRPN